MDSARVKLKAVSRSEVLDALRQEMAKREPDQVKVIELKNVIKRFDRQQYARPGLARIRLISDVYAKG